MIYRLLLKDWKNTSREYNILFGGMVTNACFIYLLLLIDMISVKLYKKGDLQAQVFFFFLLVSLGCWVSCYIFDKHILDSFKDKREKDYEILKILGIPSNRLKRIICSESFVLTAFPSLLGILLGRIFVQFSAFLEPLSIRIDFNTFEFQWCLQSFVLVMGIDLIAEFIGFRIRISKKNKVKKYCCFKILAGIGMILLAEVFILFFKYSIEMTVTELVLIIGGIELVFFNASEACRKLSDIWKTLYYRKLFQINTFCESCENNVGILFASFLSNLFLLYFVGGALASGAQLQNIRSDYPYDLIYYGTNKIEELKDGAKNYHEVPFLHLSTEFVSAIIISEKSFAELTGENIELDSFECVEIYQKQEEKGVKNGERVAKEIYYGDDMNLLLQDEKNMIVFGKVREYGLERIIVISSSTYKVLEKRLQQEYLQLFGEVTQEDLRLKSINDNGHLINTGYLMEIQKTTDQITIYVFMILGIIMLTEISWIISVRINDREKETLNRLQLLSVLGISHNRIIHMIKNQSIQMICIPFATGVFFALQLFIKEYRCQGGVENQQWVFWIFAIIIGLFQYIVCYFNVQRQVRKLRRQYNIG